MQTTFTVKTKNKRKNLVTEVKVLWATTLTELADMYGPNEVMKWAKRGKTLETHFDQWNEMDNPAKVAEHQKQQKVEEP